MECFTSIGKNWDFGEEISSSIFNFLKYYYYFFLQLHIHTRSPSFSLNDQQLLTLKFYKGHFIYIWFSTYQLIGYCSLNVHSSQCHEEKNWGEIFDAS